MPRVEILSVLNRAQVAFDTDDQLRVLLKKLERTRTLGLWHDHSSLLSKGYVLITVKIIYDTAVFKTQHEIEDEENYINNVHNQVEQPELHMLAICSSSVEDQAALIGDRHSCIQDLSIPLHDSKETPIVDELVFFYGDKAVQKVEMHAARWNIQMWIMWM